MGRNKLLLILILSVFNTAVYPQVRVRLFSDKLPGSVVFSVVQGKYDLYLYNGEIIGLNKGEPVVITVYNGKLAVKTRYSKGFVCDSVSFKANTDEDSFSLRINGQSPVKQYYSGDLQCFSDMGTILMINTCDIEKYISGVVKAEGGSGKNAEYFKSQAVIARTYMYRYFDKHNADRYNVCDNTHCQAFNGVSDDTLINRAALETRGLVILDHDSSLIISAFHSNCGGETASPEDVWLTSQPYLKQIRDTFCLSSRNAVWEKRISLIDWLGVLKKYGYTGNTDDPAVFRFSQLSRKSDYKSGAFSVPFRTLRNEMNLRSSFFSVEPSGEFIILKGRGYGHGVGLCQEGAMAMAANGKNFTEIIGFYYFGVLITDVKNAVILSPESNPQSQ
jgi:stage II sporulation protein D